MPKFELKARSGDVTTYHITAKDIDEAISLWANESPRCKVHYLHVSDGPGELETCRSLKKGG